MEKTFFAFKIDVDTYRGMERGVPRLLETLDRFGMKATFFLSIGPDNSGRAIFNIKNPQFLQKMWRSNPLRLYGLKTALYGTLLPAPMIALSFPHLVTEIMRRGHEVQFHAWDHRRWQDELFQRPLPWIRDWFIKGIEGFERLTGRRPEAFGAPAWLVDDRVMEMMGNFNFRYLSCSRASDPFIHETCGLIEIPSDLPCIEEVGPEKMRESIVSALEDGGIHCVPLHAEVEGGRWHNFFVWLLKEIVNHGSKVVTLMELYRVLLPQKLPVRKYQLAHLPGRATVCAR